MARPLRIQFPGALYHVTVRGNKKAPIFLNDIDRKIFLKTMREIIKKHNWLCHSYCLMDNHFHLAIETPDGNLSKGMRDLNGIYTSRFNRQNSTVGHLFQGRFKAFLVEKETYLLEVARYIVLNPVRAGLVARPEDWKWSSYRAMVGIDPSPKWLTTDWLLKFFSSNQTKAIQQFKEFVTEGIRKGLPIKESAKGVIIGSERFVYSVWESAGEVEDLKEVPKAERIIGRPALKDIFEDVCEKKSRNDAIAFAHERCGYSNAQIAKILRLTESTIRKILKK
jgi:REP element-mobilizing transposase RayT